MFFRLGAPDASKLATYVQPELTARDVEDLPNFGVAARILVQGKPSRPFVFQTFRCAWLDDVRGTPDTPR
jgi:hypothetical protein